MRDLDADLRQARALLEQVEGADAIKRLMLLAVAHEILHGVIEQLTGPPEGEDVALAHLACAALGAPRSDKT